MNQYVKILLFAMLAFFKLSALIVEHDDITALEKYINLEKNPHTVVIFDIDNTLGRLPGVIGNDEWVYGMVHHIQQTCGLNDQAAFDKVLSTYYAIQMFTPMYPVQPEALQLIERLHSKYILTYGLTARSFAIIPRTLKQLKNIGYAFSHHTHAPSELYLSIIYPAYFKKGILFAGNNNKGDLLVLFFKTIGIQPDCVIFVDDKEKNVKDVEYALKKHGISCIGIRYSRLDTIAKQIHVIDTFPMLKRFYAAHPEVTPISGIGL